MRNPIIVLCLCILTAFLSACSDAKEINQWAYVYSIGVDKGVSNNLRFSFQIPTMKSQGGGGGNSGGSGGGQSGEKNYVVWSIDAPTFYAAVNMAETSSSRVFNYMHTKYLVISEELAREGVERFVNGMMRSRQIRRIMHIIVSRDGAAKLLEEFNPVLTAAISDAQESFMDTNEENGFYIDTSYHQFFKDMKTTYRMPAAPMVAINDFSNYRSGGTPPKEFKSEGDYYAGELPRTGGDPFEFFGTALFDGDKMVGMLNGDETRGLMIVRNEIGRAYIAFRDPMNDQLNITIATKLMKNTEIKVEPSGQHPKIDVKVSLEGDLLNVQAPIEYENPEMKKILEDAFSAYIREIINKTIHKCKDLEVDVIGFGEKAVTHFLTIQEWEEYNWLSKFKDAEVSVDVEFVIRRTGTMIKTNPTRDSKGAKK
jgi:spore germination protein KC